MDQIWTACDKRLRKNSASHLFWLVQTCLNLSGPVHNRVTMYDRCAMSFLHFQKLLFFSLPSYPAEIAYLNSLNRELSNGVQDMVLFWSNIVGHSRSPRLKTVDKMSFERRKFLVLSRNKNVNPSTSPYYSDHVCSLRDVLFCTFECCYPSVLRPILLKLHILTHLIESFPTLYGLWSCIEVKLSIPLGAHA